MAIAEKYEMEAASTTSLMPGANETLKELKRMNMKMGLCTTSSEKAANYILKRFKIEDFFQIVVARDKVKYVKPNTEQFEVALKALGASLANHRNSWRQRRGHAKCQGTKSHRGGFADWRVHSGAVDEQRRKLHYNFIN